MLCLSLLVLLSYFSWTLCCLSFDLRLPFSLLVSIKLVFVVLIYKYKLQLYFDGVHICSSIKYQETINIYNKMKNNVFHSIHPLPMEKGHKTLNLLLL
jgi:hypothetical protein